jgi:hypothetical protein
MLRVRSNLSYHVISCTLNPVIMVLRVYLSSTQQSAMLHRSQAFHTWVEACQASGIPCNDKFKLEAVLGDPVKIRCDFCSAFIIGVPGLYHPAVFSCSAAVAGGSSLRPHTHVRLFPFLIFLDLQGLLPYFGSICGDTTCLTSPIAHYSGNLWLLAAKCVVLL